MQHNPQMIEHMNIKYIRMKLLIAQVSLKTNFNEYQIYI